MEFGSDDREDELTFKIVDVSPETAAQLLEANSANRRLDTATVERYASAMRRGEWKLSHQGVAVDRNGVLLDGQHRLAAVVKAGVTVRMAVAFHVDRETFSVVDAGKRRSAGDSLRLAGVGASLHMAAALRYLHLYTVIPDSSWAGSQSRLTNDQILAMYEEHPKMDECIRRARQVSASTGIVTSPCATAIYLTSRVRPDLDQDPWFQGITTGANLDVADPRLSFRNFFANTRVAGKRRVEPREHVAIYIKAWNAWVSGRRIRLLSFRKGEAMPQVIGFRPKRTGGTSGLVPLPSPERGRGPTTAGARSGPAVRVGRAGGQGVGEGGELGQG